MDHSKIIDTFETYQISLSSNPAIKIHDVSCVPNTPNTIVSCIGALVRPRDGKIHVIWMVKYGFVIL